MIKVNKSEKNFKNRTNMNISIDARDKETFIEDKKMRNTFSNNFKYL